MRPCVFGLGLATLAVITGCSRRVETSLVLPWFKIRSTVTDQVGAFAGPTRTTEFYVKRWWWRQIDDAGVGGAVGLDPNTVLYYDHGHPRLIHQGETTATFACGTPEAAASVPTGADAFDCVEVLAGPARAVATRVRIHRIRAAGDVLFDKTIQVDGPGRVFLRPMVTFYDDERTAYLVTTREQDFTTPNCALVAVTAGDAVVTAGPPDISMRDCSEAAAWTKVLGRALRHVN